MYLDYYIISANHNIKEFINKLALIITSKSYTWFTIYLVIQIQCVLYDMGPKFLVKAKNI